MSTEGNDPTAGDDGGPDPTPDPAPTESAAAPEPPPPAPDPTPEPEPDPAPPPPPPPPAAEAPAAAPPPSSAPAASFDFAAVPRSVWISAGGALILLFSVFFSWYTVSVHAGPLSISKSGSGWDTTDVAKLVALLALVALAVWAIELFANTTNLPWPASIVAGACGALAILLVLYRIFSKPGDLGGPLPTGVSVGTAWGIYLSLVAAIAVVVGAYLHMNETSS
jgi:hypothetical protein